MVSGRGGGPLDTTLTPCTPYTIVGIDASTSLEDDLKQHVVQKIGAIARPQRIIFSGDLPKTRSGKIMRRLLRDIADGRVLGDTTTLADADVVEGLRQQYEEREEA